MDRIGDYLPQSTEKSRVLVIPVGARHKCQQARLVLAQGLYVVVFMRSGRWCLCNCAACFIAYELKRRRFSKSGLLRGHERSVVLCVEIWFQHVNVGQLSCSVFQRLAIGPDLLTCAECSRVVFSVPDFTVALCVVVVGQSWVELVAASS
ncbi:hypothetical protein F511_20657 [Dorcoceras hygrometricum]|uniref:Uncharacterized protein n=1 Tax=Dorcoceras hygrometricum TaxID=472368 RepID=A0A2Z7D6P5_9LAMI|nr:hypothetical protein F511_20657 [Dorcoceras hygrometricum]